MDMWVSVPGRGTCNGRRMADARCSRGSKEAGEAQAEKWVGGGAVQGPGGRSQDSGFSPKCRVLRGGRLELASTVTGPLVGVWRPARRPLL